jgi:hypothetical protein
MLALSSTSAWPLGGPTEGEPVTLASLASDGAITLGDGRLMRLVDLEPPQTEEALAGWQSAVAALARREVRLTPSKPEADRYGRILATVELPGHGGGRSLQSELLKAGHARVQPVFQSMQPIEALLADEDEARRAGRGIWRDPAFAVIAADDIARLEAEEGRFVLVEGKILDAVLRKGRLYLNFGPDWKTDFTVTVAPADVTLLVADKFNGEAGRLLQLAGRRVRVRGFLTRYNGPELIVTAPGQIEFPGQGATANGD